MEEQKENMQPMTFTVLLTCFLGYDFSQARLKSSLIADSMAGTWFLSLTVLNSIYIEVKIHIH
jgi:hypothetical protein